ncbi:MAG: L-serine ammonia-lyase, iron-sulfur-dependent, subunit alpha [Acholeplasmatales bacterium]|nr:L-serine ammonia-lyase, iron-sulfur-dependent, subunit alpha [Acholeplasmatales bacterium]
MQSIKELFKIGNGPSSSHTMGPKNATLIFNERYKQADYVKVILYGSFALTGKGHLTDQIIDKTLIAKHDIEFDYLDVPPHPNTVDYIAYKENKEIGKLRVFSIGGGCIRIDGEEVDSKKDIYPLNTLFDIKEYCVKNRISLSDYVYSIEDDNFRDYLEHILDVMLSGIERGLNVEGTLPGLLKINRKAKMLYDKHVDETNDERDIRHLYAYAYATSEENASGGEIVTAPTCGSCGVMPAVIRYSMEHDNISRKTVIDGLAVAGLIGNLVKKNASISGAEAGCQAEVGTACAMASAYYAYVKGANIDHIDQSAEIALEHHLGLTCDPIMGYVQIPCVERNAVAAIRAINAYNLASLLNSSDSKISFDLVVKTMLETGHDLTSNYRETSLGGLAKNYKGEF